MDTSRSHAFSSAFLGDLENLVAGETSSRSVMLSACRKLSEHFGTCIFFNVHKNGVSGLVSADGGEETAYASNLKIAFDESSEFALAALHHMPAQGTEISAVNWHNFLQMRGLASPRCFSILPLMVGGRSPSVFYTDSVEPINPSDSALLLSGLNIIGRRLEELIVKKKLESGQFESTERPVFEENKIDIDMQPLDIALSEVIETEETKADGDAFESETAINEASEPFGVVFTNDKCPADYSDIRIDNRNSEDESPESSWALMFKNASQEKNSRRKIIPLPRISDLEPERLDESYSSVAKSETEALAFEISTESVGQGEDIESPESFNVENRTDNIEAPFEEEDQAEISGEAAEYPQAELPEDMQDDVDETVQPDRQLDAEPEALESCEDIRTELHEDTSEAGEDEPENAAADQEDTTAHNITEDTAPNNNEEEAASDATLEINAEINDDDTGDHESNQNIPQGMLDDDFTVDEDTSIVIVDEMKQRLSEAQTEIEDDFSSSEDTAIVVLDLLEDENKTDTAESEVETYDRFPADDDSLSDHINIEEDVAIQEDITQENYCEDTISTSSESDAPELQEEPLSPYAESNETEIIDTQEEQEPSDASTSDCHHISEPNEQLLPEDNVSIPLADYLAADDITASEIENSQLDDPVYASVDKQEEATDEDAAEEDASEHCCSPENDEAESGEVSQPEHVETAQEEETSVGTASGECNAFLAEPETELNETQTEATTTIHEEAELIEVHAENNEQNQRENATEEHAESDTTSSPVDFAAAEVEIAEADEDESEKVSIQEKESESSEPIEEESEQDNSPKSDEDKGWHLPTNHPVPIHQFPQLDQINGGDEILSLIQQGEAGVKFLQTKLLSEDSRERFKGVIGFAYCYYPPAVKFIAELLFDQEAAVRDLVIKLLPYYREQEEFSLVQDILVKALRPDSKRLAEAVFLAGELRVRKAVPQLIGLLDIGIEKENYTRALQKITLQNIPGKSTKWKKWWTENQGRDEIEWCLDALQEKDTILGRSALRYLERRAGKPLGIYNLANRKERRKAWQDWKEWWQTNKV